MAFVTDIEEDELLSEEELDEADEMIFKDTLSELVGVLENYPPAWVTALLEKKPEIGVTLRKLGEILQGGV